MSDETARKFATLSVKIGELNKRCNGVKSQLSARRVSLVAAIKDEQAAKMKLMVGELETSIDKAEAEIVNIGNVLRDDLPAIQRDKAFAESKATQLEKLVDMLSKAQDDLTAEFDQAKQAVEDGGAALKKAETGKKQALTDLADLDKYVKTHAGEAQQAAKSARAVHDDAIVAFAERDRSTLAKAKAAMEKLQIKGFERHPKDIDDSIKYFLTKWKDKGLGDAVEKQLDTYAGKLGEQLKDTRSWVASAQDDERQVRGFDLPVPDVAKALKELELGDMPVPKQKERVGKAIQLSIDAMEKAFDAIVKEFKLKSSGKQMVDVLKRKGVV